MAQILLVEDHRVTAEMMRVRLEHAGHAVRLATSGPEALERLLAARPDLVLLETMIAELDGLQLLKRMKADAVLGSIPVMVVSARVHEDDVLAALAAGADDYVTKPVSLRELVARVERVLAQGPEPLRIAVQAESGPVALGEVVDANPRSTAVRFHREGAPRFAVGEPVKLSLSSPSLPSAISLAAKVVSRAEAERVRTYGFELQRRNGAEQEMASAYLDLVGRRNAFRAEFASDENISAALWIETDGEPRELPGRLLDLSTGGARLRMKADAERQLVALESARLRFQLPHLDARFEVAVTIRHRVADASGGVAYGLRFEAARTPNFVEQLEQISEFVMRRMAERAPRVRGERDDS